MWVLATLDPESVGGRRRNMVMALSSTLCGCVFGIVFSPGVRVSQAPRMCTAPDVEPPPTSLLSEMQKVLSEPMGGMAVADTFREQMIDAFISAAPDAQRAPEAFGTIGPPSGDINVEQFGALLSTKGDVLPEVKVKAMFDAVDTNGDGLIEYVQYYKACLDEAKARKDAGKSKGFLDGLFGR